MLHLPLLVWSALLLVTAAQVGATEITDVVKQAFKVGPGGQVRVEVDRGNVEITTTPELMVYVEVIRTLEVDRVEEAQRLLQHHRLELRQEDNQILISSALSRDGEGWRGRRRRSPLQVHIRIRVPQRFDVSVSSDAGNVEIRDLQGTVESETGAGNVSLRNLRGNVVVKTGAGNLETDDLKGHLKAETGAGNITVRRLHGSAELNTGAGNITVEWTAPPSRNSHCRAGAGNVTVYLPADAAFTLQASTGIGSISSDFDLRLERSWISASAHGVVNGGGITLQLEAGMGNVALRKL
jgi:DUF4097 and DUF4098 domain-containing protein YvlB